MKRRLSFIAATLAVFVGCSDGTGPNGMGPQVSLSFATTVPTPAPSAGVLWRAAAADTFSSGADTLIISSAQVVLREIELKRVETAACAATPAEQDPCEEFETGPVLVDLPLNGTVAQSLAIDIPPGTYDEIDFEVHKISLDGQEESTFRDAHPDFAGLSIRVQGTFNGQAFTFTTDLDVEQEIQLLTPLVVDATTTSTNVTVRVDLAIWFTTPSGQVLDPATGNNGGANESVINENIKNSMKAFEDHDRDGNESNG